MVRRAICVAMAICVVLSCVPFLSACSGPLVVGADGALPGVPASRPQPVGSAASADVTVAATETSSPPKATISKPAIAVFKGSKVRLSGRVTGAVVSSDTIVVQVERRVGSKWVVRRGATAGRSKVSSTSLSWRATVVPWERGRYRARLVVTAADGRFRPATSAWVTFRSVSRRYAALTFDGGPWPKTTDSVRSTLQRYHATGTFFIIGNHLKIYPAPARRVAAAGFPMQSHTMTHPSLPSCSAARIRRELGTSSKLIAKVSKHKVTYFRPPMGETNARVARIARGMGLGQVMWDLDSWDLMLTPAAERKRVVSKVRPGDVVLMHDGGGEGGPTSKALPGILRDLRARGWDFVTLPERAALERAK